MRVYASLIAVVLLSGCTAWMIHGVSLAHECHERGPQWKWKGVTRGCELKVAQEVWL